MSLNDVQTHDFMKYNQLISSIQSNIKSLICAEGINAPAVIPFTEIILKSKKPNNLSQSYQGKSKIIPVSETYTYLVTNLVTSRLEKQVSNYAHKN